MFGEDIIVASATSAFNNAALVAPAFLWNAVLCVPLFVIIYVLARSFANKIDFVRYLNGRRVAFWAVVLSAAWVVLMGGNYSVLRDGVSLVPWLTAAILFVAFIFIGINTRDVSLPVWYGANKAGIWRRWGTNILCALLILVPVGLSDTLNWWGPILQVGAVIAGICVGRYTGRQMRDVPCALGIMFMIAIAILMQPELFRFGQLGNLTPAHLLWALGVGIAVAGAGALELVRPRGKIHHSAFIKIKWLMRVIVVLCAILFLLTEAVPVFVATVVMAFLMFAMSVWHAIDVDNGLQTKIFGCTLVMFGVMVGMPAVTALGLALVGVSVADGVNGWGRFLL